MVWGLGRYKQQHSRFIRKAIRDTILLLLLLLLLVVVCHFREIFASCELVFRLSQSRTVTRNFLDSDSFLSPPTAKFSETSA